MKSKLLYALSQVLSTIGTWLALPGLWIVMWSNNLAETAEEIRDRDG